MVNLFKAAWLLASSLHIPGLTFDHEISSEPQVSKTIAVIGAGSAGIAALKALMDLPSSIAQNWNITLYEQRGDVAGVWLPDPRPVSPPSIPYTPLYPLLRTNTPVPFMTYPGFPFPPGTPLYPSHEHLKAYHSSYASHNNLTPHIKFHHTVIKTEWVGDSEKGFWDITLLDDRNRTLRAGAEHLIVASGNNHLPRIPTWKGQEEWVEAGAGQRELFHSIYYREADHYTNRTLLVIGVGASGQDAAVQTVKLTRKTYVSVRHEVDLPTGSDDVVVQGEVSHFTREGVHFVDGTVLTDVDSVLLATGYEQRKPFLEAGGVLTYDPSAHSNASSSSRGGALVTNTNYIFPLHQHILSLSPQYPVNALSFIGLPTRIANCPSDYAQSLFAVQAIAKPWILPSRAKLLEELADREEDTRRAGLDPYVIGHAMLPDRATSNDYQDDIVDFLKQKAAIPDDGHKYVEEWRRNVFNYDYLKRGWKHLEALGVADDWVRDVKTERQWTDLMYRVNAWQESWEKENNIPFIDDTFASY